MLDLKVARVEFTVKGPLNLNSATPEELEELPGIGPELARRIVAYREAHGPFRSVEELLEVPGIGPAILARIRDLVTIGEPEPEPPR
ncbi:ComEA family DNA-binding protein [Candidatus Bipolaricaulota sp. J31]